MVVDKILFLDVDGVLNSLNSGGLYALKKPCLRRLTAIVKDTGCKIVLSSTWRKDWYALRRLKRVLSYRGLEIFDVTPILYKDRGYEIEQWLTNNGYLSWNGELKCSYAIVDDDNDMLISQLPYFFQTDPQYGMTDIIAYRVAYHLGIINDTQNNT